MSLEGLYSSPESAWEHLAKWVHSEENAAAIKWTQPETNPNMWEGHDQGHERCYLLTRHHLGEVDSGIR